MKPTTVMTDEAIRVTLLAVRKRVQDALFMLNLLEEERIDGPANRDILESSLRMIRTHADLAVIQLENVAAGAHARLEWIRNREGQS